jgi:hypothetical protein
VPRPLELPERARRWAWAASAYGRSAARVAVRGRRGPAEERLVFVVGSPRSGTTFVAEALGAQPGFVDLGEVIPLKAAIPELAGLPADEAARRLRRVLERVRRLGLAGHLRAVEQTPESAFLLPAIRLAYPAARALHVVRDGRDVVCSVLERGWLAAGRAGRDDARLAYGPHARFWVEPERRAEFARTDDARRAAWMWRRYVSAARSGADGFGFELRYEALVADPEGSAREVARELGVDPHPLARSFSLAHARSVGRWRSELKPAQLADVEREAGALLAELGYAS